MILVEWARCYFAPYLLWNGSIVKTVYMTMSWPLSFMLTFPLVDLILVTCALSLQQVMPIASFWALGRISCLVGYLVAKLLIDIAKVACQDCLPSH